MAVEVSRLVGEEQVELVHCQGQEAEVASGVKVEVGCMRKTALGKQQNLSRGVEEEAVGKVAVEEVAVDLG